MAVPAAALPPSLEQAGKSVVLVQAETSPGQYHQGSGIVLSSEFVATNAHVVRNAYHVRVLKDDKVWVASALCLVPDRDLVVLRIPGLQLPPAATAPRDALQQGLRVVSLGFPGGVGVHSETGTVTALWSFRGDRLIQTDTHNRPGSSGGGLFTQDGRLLGITTFNMSMPGGMDFAVPVDWVLALIQDRSGVQNVRCPLVVVDRLLQNFSEMMVDDPENIDNWEAFTRKWVQDSPEDANAWFAQGTALDHYFQGGQPDQALVQKALDSYGRAVALNPRHAKAWNNLGAMQDNLNRFTEAQASFRHAILADPSYGLAWLNLGASLLNASDLRGAAEALARGLTLQGDQPTAWARLAFCELSLNRLTDAIQHYRIALRYAPFHAEWWGEVYKASIQARQPSTAQEALERVRALAPELEKELLSAKGAPATR